LPYLKSKTSNQGASEKYTCLAGRQAWDGKSSVSDQSVLRKALGWRPERHSGLQALAKARLGFFALPGHKNEFFSPSATLFQTSPNEYP
jgi:hypothetical protein